MTKLTFITTIGIIFTTLAILAMQTAPSIPSEKIPDNIIDMIYAYILIIFSSILFSAYRLRKNKNILTVCIGLLIIVFNRIFQIYLQTNQLPGDFSAIGYSSLMWGISDLIAMIGIIVTAKGLWGVSK